VLQEMAGLDGAGLADAARKFTLPAATAAIRKLSSASRRTGERRTRLRLERGSWDTTRGYHRLRRTRRRA
jgi:hypothetical protein